MRLRITKSAHSNSYSVIKSAYINKKRTTVTVEILGNDKYIRETYGVDDAEAWARAHVAQLNQKAEEEDNGVMPHFEKGESGPHDPSVLKRTTQPPKPYTEGTLLRAMETAGKTVDDEELRDAMKENGIGRPSTRAAIIETLFKRRYIRKERKSLAPTMAGIQLIDTIHEPLLKSAALTGLWEKKLRMIERGEYSAAQFIGELKTMIGEIVLNVLRDNHGGAIAI